MPCHWLCFTLFLRTNRKLQSQRLSFQQTLSEFNKYASAAMLPQREKNVCNYKVSNTEAINHDHVLPKGIAKSVAGCRTTSDTHISHSEKRKADGQGQTEQLCCGMTLAGSVEHGSCTKICS